MELKIDYGQHVKLIFRNGMIEEGTVEEWSSKIAIIKSLTSDNILIIQDTAQDILAIKMIYSDPEPAVQEMPEQPVYIEDELELEQYEPDMQLRAAKLADLRLLRGREERERVRQHMTTFRVSETGSYKDRYGLPGRLQKPISFDPGEEG